MSEQTTPAVRSVEAYRREADRAWSALMGQCVSVGRLVAQNQRMAKRIEKHRRIITRLLAERRAAKEAARG